MLAAASRAEWRENNHGSRVTSSLLNQAIGHSMFFFLASVSKYDEVHYELKHGSIGDTKTIPSLT